MHARVIRSSQSYIFPIHLSEDVVPAAVFYATITPMLAWFVIKKTIVEPMNAEHRQRKLDKVREANKQRIAEKRREAEAAVDLMAALYERICDEERQKHGLIIMSARYGKFDDDNNGSETTGGGGGTSPTSAESSASSSSDWSSHSRRDDNLEASTIVDVTLPLQCLTRDSKLRLQKSSKSQLPGFYDPCVGEAKVLKIDYMYKDVSYTVQCKDEEEMRLPNGEFLPKQYGPFTSECYSFSLPLRIDAQTKRDHATLPCHHLRLVRAMPLKGSDKNKCSRHKFVCCHTLKTHKHTPIHPLA